MSYRKGHPVRPVAGRLALDFLNTADWTAEGAVAHEKLETLQDAVLWMRALGLPELALPTSLAKLHAFRHALRAVFLANADGASGVARLNETLGGMAGALIVQRPGESLPSPSGMSLLQVVAVSAAGVLADPREVARVKLCPGADCGWLFLDETRNARRRWCQMETCGNRAKARRSYARKRATAAQSD